jgi:hypothetical protein
LVEQISIARRPTYVFRFCHDVDRRAEWDKRVTHVQILTHKPIRRGTMVRIDTHPAVGPLFSWEGEFVEYSFPSNSTLKVIDAAPSSYFVAGSEEWHFESSRTGTLFTLAWDYRPRGLLGRLVDVLIRRARTRRAIKESLKNLRRMAEAKT